jgi:hypothetical protein
MKFDPLSFVVAELLDCDGEHFILPESVFFSIFWGDRRQCQCQCLCLCTRTAHERCPSYDPQCLPSRICALRVLTSMSILLSVSFDPIDFSSLLVNSPRAVLIYILDVGDNSCVIGGTAGSSTGTGTGTGSDATGLVSLPCIFLSIRLFATR